MAKPQSRQSHFGFGFQLMFGFVVVFPIWVRVSFGFASAFGSFVVSMFSNHFAVEFGFHFGLGTIVVAKPSVGFGPRAADILRGNSGIAVPRKENN